MPSAQNFNAFPHPYISSIKNSSIIDDVGEARRITLIDKTVRLDNCSYLFLLLLLMLLLLVVVVVLNCALDKIFPLNTWYQDSFITISIPWWILFLLLHGVLITNNFNVTDYHAFRLSFHYRYIHILSYWKCKCQKIFHSFHRCFSYRGRGIQPPHPPGKIIIIPGGKKEERRNK